MLKRLSRALSTDDVRWKNFFHDCVGIGEERPIPMEMISEIFSTFDIFFQYACYDRQTFGIVIFNNCWQKKKKKKIFHREILFFISPVFGRSCNSYRLILRPFGFIFSQSSCNN